MVKQTRKSLRLCCSWGEKLHTAVRSRNKRISIQGSRHTSLTQPYRHYLYSQQFPFITRKRKNKIKTSENSVTQVHAQESQSAIDASHQSKHDALRDKCALRIFSFFLSSRAQHASRLHKDNTHTQTRARVFAGREQKDCEHCFLCREHGRHTRTDAYTLTSSNHEV